MVIHIQVKPGSKVDTIESSPEGNIIVKIKGRPIDGEANAYLLNYLSEYLKIPKSSLTLKKGVTSKFKTIEIDIEEEVLKEKLNK